MDVFPEVAPCAPELTVREEGGTSLPQLVWRLGPGQRACSSAVLGGGLGERGWVLNAQVPPGYRRTDPAAHLAELALAAGLEGAGVGLMTAARVARFTDCEEAGVRTVVTTGLGVRGWAAERPSGLPAQPGPPSVGTVNTVIAVVAPLSDAALVNAVATATEAKVQALLDAGADCSGTPSDAVCVVARAPAAGGAVEPFAGPRSRWGARIARTVYAATLAGAREWQLNSA
ncbi:adenosylcobinamide amidohydrolase [Streptomyces sp. XM4193]|uniref:adenosylcobinamide amidohydrolase n=1 Tax=Streptomyces sp. XM4193 TaxID=2929782 RepID=UPI001FFB4729|nr:adenosylcobinamide amidohydrolase [Streptomyces sp. XM4193]MCK1795432.1 adenosylcobinamide amidohydrolase [Streptomyces sp. XM4193]